MKYSENLYSEQLYADIQQIEQIETPDLISYLPPYYQNVKEMVAIQNTLAQELGQINIDIEDLIKQCFVDTATWGLEIWERIFGIQTDKTKLLDQRRSMIKAKMRGAGTVNIEQIKNIARAFLNGELDVTENFANYSIDIEFTDYGGVPPNRDDLTKILREIIPAHLEINYILNYLLWSVLRNLEWTWDDIDAMDITWADLEVYK
jgi:hypothetical protein